MSHKYYTVLIVPDNSPKTRKLRVPQWVLTRSAIALSVLLLAGVAASVHYFNIVGDVTENKILRDENVQLHNDLKRIRERVSHISSTLARVERLNQHTRRNVAADPLTGLAGTGALEQEIRRKSVKVPFDLLVQPLGGDAV